MSEKGLTPTAKGLPDAWVNPPEPLPRSTVTLLPPLFATAMSRLPSPLKSAPAIDSGSNPGNAIGLPAAAVKPPAPFPSNNERLRLSRFSETRSGLPSPLKSPTTSHSGVVPTGNGLPGTCVNAPAPFPSSTVTLLLPWVFATARSGLPSPLKSPAVMNTGPNPTKKGLPEAGLNLPVPSPSNTVTVLPLVFATARSGLPSPLKSRTTNDSGSGPTAKGLPGAGMKPPVPFPGSTVTLLPVEFAVARSGTPSLLKSPTATATGEVLLPAENGLPVAAVNWAPAVDARASKPAANKSDLISNRHVKSINVPKLRYPASF